MTQHNQSTPTPAPPGGPPPGWGGGGDDLKTLQPGQKIVAADGRTLQVYDYVNGNARVVNLGEPANTRRPYPLRAGTYTVAGLNQALQVTQKGVIVASGTPGGKSPPPGSPAPGDLTVNNAGLPMVVTGYDDQGNPTTRAATSSELDFLLGPDWNSTSTGSTAAPQLVGYQGPDPWSAIQALMEKYDREVTANNIPYEDALTQLDNEIKQFTALYNYEASKGTFEQNAAQTTGTWQQTAAQATGDWAQKRDQQLMDIAAGTNADILARQTARTNRGQNIADTRRLMGQSFAQDILPSVVPAGMALPELSGFGPPPRTRINPDQIYGIQTLRDIPDISPNLAMQYPTPSPVPTMGVPAMPTPRLSPPPQWSPVPGRNIPPPPNIDALIAMLIQGQPGFFV